MTSTLPRPVELTEQGEQLARSIVRAAAPSVGAYLSGSIIAGLGNARSDLDLFLVDEQPPDTAVYQVIARDYPVRVDVECVTVAQIDNAVSLLSDFTDTFGSRPQMAELTLDRLDFAVRFFIGRDLSPSQELAERRKRINELALKRIIMARAATGLANLVEDVEGAVESDDWYTALDCSCAALRQAIDCVLAASGDYYRSEKFLFRRLARHASLDLVLRRAWTLLEVPPMSSESLIRSTVIGRVNFASWLIGMALLNSWDGAKVDLQTKAQPPSASRTLVRAPFRALLRFSDGLYMPGPISGARVGLAAAWAWLLADGQTRSSLADRVTSRLSLDQSMRSRIAIAIDRLVDEGIVVERSD